MAVPSLSEFAALSGDILCVFGAEGQVEWASPTLAETLGLPLDTLLGHGLTERTLPEDVQENARAFQELQRTGKLHNFIARYLHADGDLRHLSWNGRASDDGSYYAIARDLTEEIEATRRRASVLRQLRMAERLARIGRWRFRLGAEQVEWSREVFRIHGRDPNTGDPTLEQALACYHPDDVDQVGALVERMLGGETLSHESRIRRPDGEVRRVRSTGRPERDERGEIIGIFGVFQDITDLRQVEREAEEARSLLELFLAEAPIALFQLDPEDRLLALRGAQLETFGTDESALAGQPLDAVFPPGHPIHEAAAQARQGHTARFDHTDIAANGEPYSITAVVLSDPNHPGHVVGIIVDRTDTWKAALQAEQLAHKSELLRRRLHTAFDATGAGLWEWDIAGDAITWGHRIEEMLGIDAHEERSMDAFLDRVHPEERASVREALEAHLEHDVRFDVAFRARTGDDDWMWTRTTGQVIRDEEGVPLIMVGSTEDISAYRRVMDDLRRAAERAREGSRAKSQFIANVSHEIRTPMNAILGLTELLLTDTELTDAQAEHLRDITSASHMLLRLIGDVLDLSRAEAGALRMRQTSFLLESVLQEQARLHRGPATRKGLFLDLDLDALPANLGVRGDPDRLAQIIGNLLGNAIKFTEQGGVCLRVAIAVEDAGTCSLRIDVVDSGPGIPIDRQRSVFGVFEQLDDSNTRQHGGAGLGLAISRQLAEQMGGSLRVSCPDTGGSVFSLRLRLPTTEVHLAPPDADEEAPLPAGLRVLVVEDNPVNQKVVSLMLERLGCAVTCADNGEQGLKAFGAACFQLVLMDVQMPVMDGLTATRRLRAMGARAASVPIIGVTAHASDEDLAKCLEAGMDARLTKPLSSDALRAALVEHLGQTRSAAV